MAKKVSPMRSTIAPSTPQRIPCRRLFGERLRHASAITTALSPDNRMLTVMISRTATQNCGVLKSVTGAAHVIACACWTTDLDTCSSRYGQERLENTLQQLSHLRWIARDLDTARFHP